MFKSELSNLKGTIRTAISQSRSTEYSLDNFIKSVPTAMDDAVGRSAMESQSSILKCFKYNFNNGYKNADNVASSLGKCMDSIDRSLKEAKSIESYANSIMAGVR